MKLKQIADGIIQYNLDSVAKYVWSFVLWIQHKNNNAIIA